MQFGAETPMDTQELLIHDCRQWQCAEGFDASLIDFLAVFVFALELEGEIIRKMPAFMVSSQEPKCVGVPDLESPKI